MAELQRAFISPDMISVGDSLIEAVVTAGRWPEDGLVITIRPVEAPQELASLIVVIDERDLGEVQKLLGEERSRFVPADDEGAVPDDDVVAAHTQLALAKALKTLRVIADMEDTKQEPEDSWRETLFRTIELAQWTLDWIEVEAGQSEASNGTPSDS